MSVTTVRPRTSWIVAIFEVLDRKRWVSRDALLEAVGNQIPTSVALKVFDARVKTKKAEGAGRNTRIKIGRKMQLMLSCITLVQHGKLEQRGRGSNKEYRRLI